MLSTVLPAISAWTPHELLPIMPPSVQRLCVAGSGAKVRWCTSAASRSAIEHDAGLHARDLRRRIEREDAVQVLREIDHHRDVAALPGEAGARAARQDRRADFAARCDRRLDVGFVERNDQPDRDLPVVRGVGGIRARASRRRSALRRERSASGSRSSRRLPGNFVARDAHGSWAAMWNCQRPTPSDRQLLPDRFDRLEARLADIGDRVGHGPVCHSKSPAFISTR